MISNTLQALGPLLGRILIGALFVLAGVLHMRDQSFFYPYVVSFSGYTEAKLPFAYLIEFGAAIALILGWKTRWAAAVLIFYTVGLTVLLHGLTGPDDAQFYLRLTHVAKNAALIGGLLYLAVFGGGPLSLDEMGRGAR